MENTTSQRGNRGRGRGRGRGQGRGRGRGGARGRGRGGGHAFRHHSPPPPVNQNNVFTKQCFVCDNALAKYKCTICRAPCCSLACLNSHKADPCEAPPKDIVPTTESVPNTTNNTEPRPWQTFIRAHRFVKGAPGVSPSALIQEEEAKARIPLPNLVRLVHTDGIHDALKSSAIRDTLLRIDAAQDDDVREGLLMAALDTPEFAAFADQCLEVIRAPDTMVVDSPDIVNVESASETIVIPTGPRIVQYADLVAQPSTSSSSKGNQFRKGNRGTAAAAPPPAPADYEDLVLDYD
ncbi:hypothetical protein BC828DRAFT_393210 [Blastocladiella britannica]|nr:hypothetical protein BC828DRAFT_393210 [Blastocladiella britannica]